MPQPAQHVTIDGRILKLSHLDKPRYPDGTTKAALIDYYARIAPVLLPHINDRILTRARYPHGTTEQGFFEKHTPPATPEWIRTASIHSKTNDRDIDYVVADETAALVWTANLSTIELHTPQWRLATPVASGRRCPDRLIIDLDPGQDAGMTDCLHVAHLVRERLETDGLTTYPKTSGKNGLHIVAPISATQPDTTVVAYAKTLARRLATTHPDLITATMGKHHRRDGRVLIDWSQNNAGKTTVAAYSLRAGHHPTVSTPLTWHELDNGHHGPHNPNDVLQRLTNHGDHHAPTLKIGPPLPHAPTMD